MKNTALKINSAGALLFGWMVVSAFSPASKTITIGLQAGSVASWEIAAMEEAGIAEHHAIDVEITDLADAGAVQAALQAGDVDAILTDFVWTSLVRQGGTDLVFVPHSRAEGGLMVVSGGPVAAIQDLDGAAIAVADGGAIISHVALQAYYAAQTGGALADAANVQFVAPAQVNELLLSGGVGAAVNAWDLNARAAANGAVELISVADMLAAAGVERTPPVLGWVFSDRWARSHRDEIARFLDASFETRQDLLEDDALWDSIRPVMGEDLSDEAFIALRDAYRRTIVTSFDQADIDAAAKAFGLVVQYGGADLVGDATEMAEGTFWGGYRVGG